MTFSQFLSILRARKKYAFSVFFLIVGLAISLSLVLPKKYTAIASIVVDVKPDPIAAMGYPSMMAPGFMATQADILTSDRVALRVIRDLKLLDNPQLRQQWLDDTDGAGTIEPWLIEILGKQLDVKPSRDSNVIQVAYKAPDARFAAGLANAFAQAYIATTLELRVDPARQFSTFFNEQAKGARDALERAQTKVSSFQREKGIIANDERLDVENSRLNELSSQLVQIQAIASESGSRQVQAQGASGDRIQDVLGNPLIASMKADLARSEARLQELNSKLGENNPQVIETKANIAEMRSRIESETKRVTGGVTVSNAINRQREVQVKQQLEEQRAKVLRMKAVRDEGQVLVSDVENAQKTYDGVMARLTQTAMEAQSTQSYASILTTAIPPNDPSFPKIILNTLVSIVLGIISAIAVVLWREMRDPRAREPKDLVAVLGLPVLGILPKPTERRNVSGRHALMLQRRVIGLPPTTSIKSV